MVKEIDSWVRGKGVKGIGALIMEYAEEEPEFKGWLMRQLVQQRLTADVDPVSESLERARIASEAGQSEGGGSGHTTINVVTPALLPSPGLRTPQAIDVVSETVQPSLPSDVKVERAEDVEYEDL
mgnify:CR=1 FL=1